MSFFWIPLTDSFDYVMAGLIVIVALVILGFVAYGLTWLLTPYGSNFVESGVVKTLSYHAAHTSTGIGPAIGGQNGGLAITTSYTPSEYDVVFKLDSGKLWIADDKGLFKQVDQGDRVNLTFRSKRVWGEDNWDLVSWEKV